MKNEETPRLNDKSGMMEVQLNTLNPPSFTAEEIARLEALAALDDTTIDTSDIPELSEADWAHAIRGNRFMKPTKVNTSVRLDADIVHWLKSKGRGYQTRLNTFLRKMMMEEYQSGQA